jgi:hypothetical protein
METLITIAVLLFIWGWVLLGARGIYFLVVPKPGRKKRRVVLAIGMLAVATLWGWSIRSYTCGVNHQTIQTSDGSVEASIWHIGSFYNLIIRRCGIKESEFCLGRVPVRMFWIQEGKELGLIDKQHHYIVYIEKLLNDLDNRRNGPSEGRAAYFHQPTPEEEKLFEAADKASQ